jgi:protein SCO1
MFRLVMVASTLILIGFVAWAVVMRRSHGSRGDGKALDSRPGPLLRRLTHPLFVVLVVVLLFAAPMAAALNRPVPKPPGVYVTLPSFQLTNEKGNPFGSKQLAGRVWVASFAFTSCPAVCPKLMEQVAVVQHRSRNAGAGVALVTFSVDPETDTPEKLHAYARRFRASPYRWNFLTGELTSIEKTVVKGFKLAMGREKIEGGENLFNIFHSERLVLVDQKSQIRGYYEANKVGIDKLMKDIGLVLNEGLSAGKRNKNK